MDVLFVNPGNAVKIYQDLASKYSAIEPPTWALLLAESCRSVGFEVGILDVNAERLNLEQAFKRITIIKPRLLCFVVYGQNVNAGTVGMSGAIKLSNFVKLNSPDLVISYIGSYVQALPIKTLIEEKSIDIIFTNEGVYSLRNLLSQDKIDLNDLSHIRGIGWRKDGVPVLNSPEIVVPQEKLDTDLPGYAWDLLPFHQKRLDMYRSPMWHAEYDETKRTPYAAIQTSLGCKYACDFCMINIVNRNDNDEIGVASNYSSMRYWSTEFIINEFDKLVEMGVQTIRIVDEMFLLNKNYYLPLCQMLSERGYGNFLRMWAYSRIDTVSNPTLLKLIRNAGIKWLCLGIESGDKNIRLEVSKGMFKDVDIKRVVDQIHNSGIEIMANYIFGLPKDTYESMQTTLDLSKELCTAGWNAYAAMALPGSKLYKDAIQKGIPIPKSYEGFSFHSYETLPLPTESLTPAEVLKFRDTAFYDYHSYSAYQEIIVKKYGNAALDSIQEMLKVKLKRKILGD